MKLSTLALALLAVGSDAFSMHPSFMSKTSNWDIENISPVVRVEGYTRHTFDCKDLSKDVVQVAMNSPNGRPVDAEVNLWLGPDYTPSKVAAHSENGSEFPLQALVGTKGKVCQVEVKNTGHYTFPLNAACSYAISPLANAREDILVEPSTYVEGGAIKIQSFGPEIEEMQVLIKTQGKNLNAQVELLNGPNNVKCVYDIYSSNGEYNALFVVLKTPGSGNAIRIKNKATLEYPLEFWMRASESVGSNPSSAQWSDNTGRAPSTPPPQQPRGPTNPSLPTGNPGFSAPNSGFGAPNSGFGAPGGFNSGASGPNTGFPTGPTPGFTGPTGLPPSN